MSLPVPLSSCVPPAVQLISCLRDFFLHHQDLKRLARTTGGTVVSTLADMDGNETFDPACLGSCEKVEETRVGDGELVYFKGCATQRATTIVLRGANGACHGPPHPRPRCPIARPCLLNHLSDSLLWRRRRAAPMRRDEYQPEDPGQGRDAGEERG